jgi:hypothetical protein
MYDFSDVRYETPLTIRREIEAVIRDGQMVEAILVEPFVITFTWVQKRWRLEIPAGFTAAPSVPSQVQSMLPFSGGLVEASVIHDWAYYHRIFDPYASDGRLASDNLFEACLEAAGVEDIYRAATYRAVRGGGSPSYRKNTFKEGCGPVLAA